MQYGCFLCLACLVACQKNEVATLLHFPALMEIPAGFPPVDFPEDNAFSIARWELGKKLFFDPVMSADSSISCADCHLPKLAFSDRMAFSDGVENRLGTRNTPTLANVAYHPYFTREGGLPTLEMQVLVPIQEHNEFDFNIVLIAERLARIPDYVERSKLAYDRPPDHFVITRALACFERSLLSGNSRYDQYSYQGKSAVLSEKEKQGLALFFSEKTNCSTCHADFNFTNYAFENNGLYENYPDSGRFRFSGDSTDIARFKVPTLRNIAETAPYMHDGSFATLEDVVEHYVSGGAMHPNKSELIAPMDLTEYEKEALVLFLKSLTDESFLQNPIFKK